MGVIFLCYCAKKIYIQFTSEVRKIELVHPFLQIFLIILNFLQEHLFKGSVYVFDAYFDVADIFLI